MAKGTVSKVSRKNALRFLAGKTGVAASSSSSLVNEGNVAQRAYLIYLQEGRPDGRHLDHWLKAEAELSATG